MGGINQFIPNQHAPIMSIIDGLHAAHELGVIGAKGKAEALQAELLRSQNDQAQRENVYQQALQKEDSPESKQMQAVGSGLFNLLPKEAKTDEMKSALTTGSGSNIVKAIQSSGLQDIVKAGQQKNMLDAMTAKLGLMVGVKQDANQRGSNTDYDRVIGKQYETRLDAANRVKDLIGSALNKTLIPSENLGQQLATDINMLQSGHTSVSGTEHSRPNTLFGKGGTLAHFISGDPQAAITDSDLKQMQIETNKLYEDIGKQHAAKFSSWIKNMPKSVQPTLQARYQESRQQYFPSNSQTPTSITGGAPQGTGAGSMGGGLISDANASTGGGSAGPKSHPQDSAAIQWAKANPKDPRSATILKMNGVK